MKVAGSGSNDNVRDPVIETFREELIEAADQGVDAVERTFAAWCSHAPALEAAFRQQAQAILLLWGLREPERLGQYQLLDVLTTGGMGKIYRAKEDVTGRIVVIKTILAGHLSTLDQRRRFETERRLLSRLHDSHIVPLLATGQEGYLTYMVMPFIPGVTLKNLVEAAVNGSSTSAVFPAFETLFDEASKAETKRRQDKTLYDHLPQPPPAQPSPPRVPRSRRDPRRRDYFQRVALMMEHVAAAIQHIHTAGILHRDLKPSNIIVESSGHSWVIDIGLGREVGAAEPANSTASLDRSAIASDMTLGVGTPAYMAPEQRISAVQGAEGAARQDSRTDVWGLGATLYELICLQTPCPQPESLQGHSPEARDPWPRDVPAELRAICLRALRPDPDERYASAAEFEADLRHWRDSRPTRASERRIDERCRHWFPAAPWLDRALVWCWVRLRRFRFWCWRKPAAALVGLLLLLGVLSTVLYAQERARIAQRELEILKLPQLRRPIRQMGWFLDTWEHVRSLRRGDTFDDPQLQGHAAAALEGLDARIVKSFQSAAESLEFSPNSEQLLMVQSPSDDQGAHRTTLWDRTSDQVILQRELGSGVVTFRPEGVPLQLSRVPEMSVPELTKELQLYDVASGNVLHTFQSPLEGLSDLQAIALADRGSHLAAVAVPCRKEAEQLLHDRDACVIVVWNADSEAPIVKLQGQSIRQIQGLILSPDGRLLAAWDDSGEVIVWTLPDGREHARFRVGRMPISCLAFGREPVWQEDPSAFPWLLAIGESSGLITIWDLNAKRPRSVCRGSPFTVRAMDFSDDGALLLSGARVPTKVWDVATGTCLLDVPHGDEFTTLSFAPDGRHYAGNFMLGNLTERKRGMVSVWELEHGRGVRTLHGLQGVTAKTAFSADGSLVAAATHEWQIGVWERSSGRLRRVLPAPVGLWADSLGFVFDASGRRLACSVGHQAQLWDVQADQLLRSWDLPKGLCDSLAFVEPDRLILVRYETQTAQEGPYADDPATRDPRVIRIYDLFSPAPTTPLRTITDFPLRVVNIGLAPTGDMFVAEGTNWQKELRSIVYHVPPSDQPPREPPSFWDQASAASTSQFDPTGRVLSIGPTPSGRVLFEATAWRELGKTHAPLACLSPGAETCLGPDGNLLVLSQLPSGRELMRLEESVPSAGSSTFSRDGRHAAVGRLDGTVSLLDLVEINRRLSEVGLGW